MHKETLLRTQVIGGDERDRALTSQVALLSSQSFCINQLNKSTGARTGGLGHLLTLISYRLESCFRQWHVASVRGEQTRGLQNPDQDETLLLLANMFFLAS